MAERLIWGTRSRFTGIPQLMNAIVILKSYITYVFRLNVVVLSNRAVGISGSMLTPVLASHLALTSQAFKPSQAVMPSMVAMTAVATMVMMPAIPMTNIVRYLSWARSQDWSSG